jgi:DNA repair exonuclease SbcCD ATPase subunit
MIKFKKLHLKNGLTYKDQIFELDGQGLVSIVGQNGAGKTTVWSILQSIFYGSTPLGHSRDDLVISDKEDCCFSISFEKDGVDLNISILREGGKWRFDISENGKPKIFKGVADSKKFAQEILGLTRVEFEGSVHLTQDSQHVLILGKPADRRKYIAEFFGIDDRYDKVLVACEAETEKVKKKIQDLEALSHTRQTLLEQLKLTPYVDTKNFQDQIANTQRSLTESYQRYTEYVQKQSDTLKYEQLLPEATKYTNPETLLKEAERQLLDLKIIKSQILENKDFNKRADENNYIVKKVRDEISKSVAENPGVETKSLDIIQKECFEIKAIKNRNVMASPLRIELKSLPSGDSISTAPLREELKKVQLEKVMLQKKFTAITNGVCHECGAKHTKKEIGKVTQDIDSFAEMEMALIQDINLLEATNEKLKKRAWIEAQIKDIPEFTEFMERVLVQSEKLYAARQQFDLSNAKLSGRQLIKLRPVQDHPTLESDIQTRENEVLAVRNCLLASRALPPKPTLSAAEITSRTIEISNICNTLNESNQKLQVELSNIEATNRVHLKQKQQLDLLEAKLQELPNLKQQEFFWNKMEAAYGSRGLRVAQLDIILGRILKRLPFYANKLFKEKDLYFTSEIDGSNVYIIANRKKADGTKIQHDISIFSGGEKRKMSSALIVTLADCISASKKSNILVLDEIDSALDDTGKFMFINELVPSLKSRFSSVFLISHDSDVQQANIYDKVWKVEKQDHQSKITVTNLT